MKIVKKLFLLVLAFVSFFVVVSCGDKPNDTPEQEIENYEITLEVGNEKKISLNDKYQYDVTIDDDLVVSFSNNTIKALKEGKTKVTITTSNDSSFKQVYTVIVIKTKELVVKCDEEMYVGDKTKVEVSSEENTITSFELFFQTGNDVLSFDSSTSELRALKAGSAKITVTATVDNKTLSKEIIINVSEKETGFFVVDLPNKLYANQTYIFTVETKDGETIDEFEMTSLDDEIMDCYPEDHEIATFESGNVEVLISATVNGERHEEVVSFEVLPALVLEVSLSDVITTKEPLSFSVLVMPDNVELEKPEVSSSDNTIFTVDGKKVNPLSAGKALLIIRGTYDGATVSFAKEITVKEYVPSYITSNIDDFMIVNNELDVAVSVKPDNEEIKDLVITSTDNTVIEVTNNKLVAKKVGSSVVKVSCNNLEKEYLVEVIDIESIEVVVKEEIYLHEVLTFDVIAKPSNKKINPSSLNISYKTKNSNVLINGKALYGSLVGQDEIEVELSYKKNQGDTTLSKLSATKEIEVVTPSFSIERLTISSSLGMLEGESQELVINKFPANGVGDIAITSSASDVISVEGTTITALKPGKSEIKVSLVGSTVVSSKVEITVLSRKEVMEVTDGVYNGESVTARYREDAIKYYYELMCGVKETTYIGSTSTVLSGDVDGYSGITGDIIPNEYYAQNVHVLEVPSRTDVVVVPWANLNGHKWSLTTVKGLIANFEEHNPGYKVIAAVNGDFFDINANKNLPYSTTGENISNGEFYKVTNDFSHMGGTLGFTNDGSSLSLVAGANVGHKYSDYFLLDVYGDNDEILYSFRITGWNLENPGNENVLYFGTYNENQSYVPVTPIGTNVFVVENAELALPSADSDFYGKGVITSNLVKELNVGDFAISTSDSEIIDKLNIGTKVRVQRVFVGEFASVTSATGYNGVVYDEEGIVDFIANGNLSNRAPRTVIGMKEDGTLVMMVVDGRQGDKDMYGCDGYELTAIMRAYGCIKAYNVDGGGSSTIVVRSESGLEVLNLPSDGHERSDGNCILICTVDPDYKTAVTDIKETSAKITVSTDLDSYKEYKTYISFEGEMLEVKDGEVELTGLVHNNKYSYRVYYKKNGEYIATQSVGSFTTPKANFQFLGLYIEEKDDSFVLSAYSIDNDKAGNIYEMTIYFNDKTVFLKNGTLEIKKDYYGDTIEKIGYQYWYNDENGRNLVTVTDGLYFK